jgi:hypothetical protein
VVEWPAASPNVLSVGGTSLTLNSDSTWQSETAWNGSGGGVSRYEATPTYQSGMGYAKRATPDVSYDANPNTGFYIYDTYGYGGVMGVGGTSAGAPQWAAMVAIADEMAGHNLDGVSQTLPAIYSTAQSSAYSSDFHDITSGSAGRNRAGTGFDLVTGWGSPIADAVVPAIAANAPALSSVTAAPQATAPPTHGKHPQVAAIQVTPAAPSSSQQTVALGIGAVSGLTVSLVSVPMQLSSACASVSSSSASPTPAGGPSSTTVTIGFGQDLVGAASSSASRLAQPVGTNADASAIGPQTNELDLTHIPPLPEAQRPVAPAAPNHDRGQSGVGEDPKPAGGENSEDASALPVSMIPAQSRLDSLGDESASETRSKHDAVWGACLIAGAMAAMRNSRGIRGRRANSVRPWPRAIWQSRASTD